MENGVTLRPDKLHFCKRSVTFAGYVLDWEEYHLSKELVRSIMEFTMPTKPTLTNVRAWFGLVNQVAPFIVVAPFKDPFRELLKKPVAKLVDWDEQLQAIFSSVKDTIEDLAAVRLRYYDVSRPTAVFTDYSCQGAGFYYAAVLPILLCYTEGWQDGFAADALSRYPMLFGHPEESDEADDELVCAAMVAATSEAVEGDGGRVVDVKQVKEEAAKDEEYQLLQECVSNECWTDCENMEPLALQPYFRMRRHLSCQGNIVLYTNDVRQPFLVIPMALRHAVLTNLHAEHQGRDNALQSMPTCSSSTARSTLPTPIDNRFVGSGTSTRGHHKCTSQAVFKRWFTPHATPLSDASPAQPLTGRQLKDAIPVDNSNYRESAPVSRTPAVGDRDLMSDPSPVRNDEETATPYLLRLLQDRDASDVPRNI
ncbi:hypothetical protein C7M84_003304 [Penaeus vannamei]|uniref:Reverse transcriptase/retrotransposon-derived protein RNase H-like domain-containing protein n=1 Tax=Penaeus vannamei TaxID=6689 RepID=A0A3R7SVY9_PENVA|nr:hypothetical protein C7M84_003304 [Penaeus vannamei]